MTTTRRPPKRDIEEAMKLIREVATKAIASKERETAVADNPPHERIDPAYHHRAALAAERKAARLTGVWLWMGGLVESRATKADGACPECGAPQFWHRVGCRTGIKSGDPFE